MREYDVVVIGAGPVGENAADRARAGGLSVAVVEERLAGGECSYFACIPSKALLRPMQAERAAGRVRGVVPGRLDPAEVLARRDYWIGQTEAGIDDSGQAGWIEGIGADLLRGHGRLVGEQLVEVDGEYVRANRAVVLATGSRAAVPDIPGLRDAKPWTNVEATTTRVVPESLAILGGGVVACELAQAFTALGCRVSVFERSPRLLGRTEDVAGAAVLEQLREDGVEVRLETEVTRVERREDGSVVVELKDGARHEAEQVLCALGRTPNSDDIGLETIGLRPDARGFVSVDDHLRVPGLPWLYAVGDLNGRALLTHMGKYQARICGDLIAGVAAGDGSAFATELGSPQVIFTDPEVAAVGLTSSAARAAGVDVSVTDVPIGSAAGAGLQADGYQGTARMVVDRRRGVVVGMTFVGQDVADLVHSATVAVVGEVPVERLWHAVPSFPTISEVWLRLLEAYRDER